jgi:hypothetical protein
MKPKRVENIVWNVQTKWTDIIKLTDFIIIDLANLSLITKSYIAALKILKTGINLNS